MNFIIRGYHHGDEHKILEMFNEVFHQNRELSHWYWKYRDNPYGSYFISIAETPERILAAHYAGYPVKLYFCLSDNRRPTESLSYQLGDKMTRKNFRAAGFGKSAVLAKTFNHFKETYASEKVPFAYGFLTYHSLQFGLLFLDYIKIEPVPYRKANMDLLNNVKNKRFKKIISQIKVEEVSVVDETWSEFFNNVAPHYKYLVKREASYLRWRYLQRPDRKYLIFATKKKSKIAGWSVFYKEGEKIIWGDALFKPEDLDCVIYILKTVQQHPIAEGADFIECWFPPRPDWWDSFLQNLGFEIQAEPNNIHFTITFVTDNGRTNILRNYFYYTMGDSDLF
jgi:hypothetical protein